MTATQIWPLAQELHVLQGGQKKKSEKKKKHENKMKGLV